MLGLLLLFLILVHYLYHIFKSMQSSEDPKFIKKKWLGGHIEPHPTEKAIIVNYKLEAAVFSEPENPMLEEKKDCQRVIRLKNLNKKTDCNALAREVVEKCDLIHSSQLSEIEQIIYYLKNRKETENPTRAVSSKPGSKTSVSSVEVEKATIRNIDEYIELLYEDLPERIRGSAYILQLARNPDNLEELEKNEAVLSALSRVLREDWRKSLDLSTNIIYVFFCFSTYSRFHNVIVQYKIGSLCMEVIEFELKRYDQMKADLNLKKNVSSAVSVPENVTSKSMDAVDLMDVEKPKEMEPPRRRIPELKQRPKSGNWSSYHAGMSGSLTRSLNSSYHENLSKEVQSPVDSPSPLQDDATSSQTEKLGKQLKLFAKKQEQLLRVAFYLLLNIAENVKLEEKMRRKSIVRMLIKTLDRHNVDLLILVVTFLKKLSIVRDNKDEMYEMNVIEKLPRLLQSSQPDLIQVTLKLIFNLSFDGGHRSKILSACDSVGTESSLSSRLFCRLVAFLSDEKHHPIATKILYHMSLDDKVKSMFTYTDCVPMVTDMILLNICSRKSEADLDLIALGVNLALNKRNAQLMVENNRLHSLMARAFKNQDTLLMKMIRNISQHETLKSHFVDFVGDLAGIVTKCDDEEFVVECLGILGNLSVPDLDYCQIIDNFSLIPWIIKMLTPGHAKDDLVLEVVILLGTFACDEACAALLCKVEVIFALIELLKAKQEDDEVVLQIIFVFQQVLRNESTRSYIIKDTECPAFFVDLMHDKNAAIRKICDYCLDIIAITDPKWASRIKLEKFRNHNAQWLSMVETQQDSGGDLQGFGRGNGDDDSDLLPAYLASDFLDHSVLYQNGDFHGDEDGDEDSNGDRTGSAGSGMEKMENELKNGFAREIETELA